MSLPRVLARLRAAERASGRLEGSVELVAVTKGRSADEVRARVLTHGDFALGESRGQELRDKRPALPDAARWHFIGTLQTNKLKYLRGVVLVHTLTRADHAAELARLAEAWGEAPEVLLQLHNDEPQKHGVPVAEVGALYHRVVEAGLRVRGVMIMAPDDDPGDAERVFRRAAEVADDLGLPIRSMGMTDDFELAIACGSTHVRVGRALFEHDEGDDPNL